MIYAIFGFTVKVANKFYQQKVAELSEYGHIFYGIGHCGVTKKILNS